MSDENEDSERVPQFGFVQFGAPTQEQVEEAKKQQLIAQQHVVNFAKASLPHVTDATKSVRELFSLYQDSPANGMGTMAQRLQQVRDLLALVREDLEWWAER